MSSRKGGSHHKKGKQHDRTVVEHREPVSDPQAPGRKLDIVLKCDTTGCLEAVTAAVGSTDQPGVEIDIISSGVGAVSQSDIFMAETGSRLILGFNVGIMPHIDRLASEHNVEIRLYEVIYRLLDELQTIAASLVPPEAVERIIGSARVIALFKSSRKGIILGCEVLQGKLALGQSFRVLGAMGPMYTGKIESLQIEKNAVREATKGQQVGLKIRDFNKAKTGDLVESFQIIPGKSEKPWQPQGKIYYPR